MGHLSNGTKAEVGVRSPRLRGSGVPTVYDALKHDILNMKLAPGDPLDETALSVRFGMSRTPVREAMVRLVADGLATTLPNRNTVVTALDFAALPDYLDALTLMYRVTTRGAAERREAIHLDRMRTLQARFAAAVADADAAAMIGTNRDFHVAVAIAAGNRYYLDLFSRLLDEGMRLLRLYYKTFDDHLPKEFLEEHDEMIEAIEARDAALADRIATKHAAQIVEKLRAFLKPSTGLHIGLGKPSVRRRGPSSTLPDR